MKNLLIVEDNPKMRQMIRSLFPESNYQIYECEDGSEALESYKLYKPEWVLMDIVMKKMDGITATKHIIDSFPDAKVIIVTDYDDESLRQKAKLAGAYDYVIKEDLSVLEGIFENFDS
jgi:CheY-like chemotaxis protein